MRSSLIATLGTIATYWWAAHLVLTTTMTLGSFLALVEYFVLGRVAISRLGWLNIWVQTALVQMSRLHEATSKPREVGLPHSAWQAAELVPLDRVQLEPTAIPPAPASGTRWAVSTIGSTARFARGER